jgi:hypothetical protein
MEKFYRLILLRAWKVAWKNKKLWFFGFFATFLGSWVVSETVLRLFYNLSEGRSIFFTINEYMNSGLFSMFSWTKMVALWQADSSAVVLALFSLLFLLVLGSIFIIMGVISQAGLVKSAVAIDEGEKISFKGAFANGVPHFWRVLGVNVLMKVVLLGLILFFAYLVSLFFMGGALLASIIYVFAIVLLILLTILISFLTIYATAFIVLRDKKIGAAIRNAWYIFKKNILINIEVGMILFIINILVMIASLIIYIFILSPFFLLYLLMLVLDMNVAAMVMQTICLGLFVILAAVIGSWYTTFQISAWSILFEELAMKKGKSKLVRILARIFPKKSRRK